MFAILADATTQQIVEAVTTAMHREHAMRDWGLTEWGLFVGMIGTAVTAVLAKWQAGRAQTQSSNCAGAITTTNQSIERVAAMGRQNADSINRVALAVPASPMVPSAEGIKNSIDRLGDIVNENQNGT